MVVDCGGGTVDITVYEMTSDNGKLKELYMATGGPHGSTGMYCSTTKPNADAVASPGFGASGFTNRDAQNETPNTSIG